MSSSSTNDRQAAAAENGWQSQAGDYAERGREAAADLAHVVERQIRQRPLGSVLIAGGLGFLLGWISTRRS